MRKRIIVGIGAVGTALALLPLFAAFEAHVVNVTARIENALEASTYSIDFGTVFPQERLDKTFDISLSQSFLDENRVDDVEYFVRQKPKCGVLNDVSPFVPKYVGFTQAVHNPDGSFSCSGRNSELLPLLCPYLSKNEITTDGLLSENDGAGLSAFHGPISLADWTLAVAQSFDVAGRLAKSEGDNSDTWNIDLKVACFGEHCAQDWADFVHEFNPQANPDDYVQPIENEHLLFGCDLWLEVSEISCTQEAPVQSTVVSDTTNTVQENGGAAAETLTFIHPAWTALIPGATWIWENDPVENPTANETFTFEKQFTIVGTVANATLDIATDNTYSVEVNGSAVCSSADESNFQLATQDVCNVTNLVSGSNTIEITVTNIALPGSTPSTNPAGLLFKLTYTASICVEESE